LLQIYGIQLPPETFVRAAAEVPDAAGTIGFPVVLKAVAAAITHKSDAGLVILDVCDAAAAADAARVLVERCSKLGVAPDGILVAKQMPRGIETALGVTRDIEMGCAVMFGTGGVEVELYNDVAFAPACLDRAGAMAMIAATRAGRRIKGFRGQSGDADVVAAALLGLGQLAGDLGDCLDAVDINPFVVYQHGAYALDGVVVLRPPKSCAGTGSADDR